MLDNEFVLETIDRMEIVEIVKWIMKLLLIFDWHFYIIHKFLLSIKSIAQFAFYA